MSLKQVLLQEIKTLGIVPYSRIVELCMEEGSKISAGERRLRELVAENDSIQPVMKQSKKGSWYIGAYRYLPPGDIIRGNVFDKVIKELRKNQQFGTSVCPPEKINPIQTKLI